ncbi:MAG: DNA mismatch repair protein MutL [Spirosomataceae bacterium]|jgi:DNA mismatch repair protein MutL
MQDIIHLLSDSIANQIAAGEVVQRPASVVKELLENSVDAKAKNIQLVIKEAGKTLIQVVDDGFGMSATDARMSFERHATSKIRVSDDLFGIRTMGFRGEALASIAAVAQVELRTHRLVDELGTLIRIEGSEFKAQEPIATPKGTNLQIKNLFFNVPARRNFLKSNAVEMKHIIDEFHRIALAHPEISFSLHHNEVEIYSLASSKLSHRIVDIFGKSYRQQLASCDEQTPFVSVSGYIGKPEAAKKSRGEQFFFVNNRFVKQPYLHHAILSAFDATIQKGSHPFYVLFIEIDPSHIDINIHPTKTEIKFDDERAVYAIIRSAVRQAIGVYNLTPSIDFESDINFGNLTSPSQRQNNASSSTIRGNEESISSFEREKPNSLERANAGNWQKLFEGLDELSTNPNRSAAGPVTMDSKANDLAEETKHFTEADEINAIQIKNRYIVAQAKYGMMLIDQRAAYERILFDKYALSISKKTGFSQQLLFPKTVELSSTLFTLWEEVKDDIINLGFSVESFGGTTIKINGIPPEVHEEDEVEIFEGLLQEYAETQINVQLSKTDSIARAFAKRSSSKYVGVLSKVEIKLLIHQLFETSRPGYTPGGERTMNILSVERLAELITR